MTNPIINLEGLVKKLYEQRDPNRDEWADWLYAHHIPYVVQYASKLARKYSAREELAVAAAWLHDCADAVMSRFDSNHETKTRELSIKLLQDSDFTAEEIAVIVDDAIQRHSCRNGDLPQTLEGKVLAVADAVAHFRTDYYLRFVGEKANSKSIDEIKQIVLTKLNRDYTEKMCCLPDELSSIEHDYQLLKELFSR